tara:strand:- start:3700 stop:4233 length:534 start_codon:yes stop_codon:yes gene_type:complete
MPVYGTNMSATSSITGARTSLTTIVSLSARPQITYVVPNYDEIPRAYLGFTRDFQIQGYNFDTSVTVYLSTNKDVYANTNELSAVTAFNLFGGLSSTSATHSLSALYPTFSAIQLPDTYYVIHSPNAMTVTISAADNIGKMDVIIANVAGYAKFAQDLTTRGLAGSGVERVIEIKTP